MEWFTGAKRAGSSFLGDDCMEPLARQIAYSWMLAFFPARSPSSSGLLGVLHLYDQMQSFLAPISPQRRHPRAPIGLQKDSKGGASITALVLGGASEVWAASGAMGAVLKAVNRAYDRIETRPFWRTQLTAIVLVLLVVGDDPRARSADRLRRPARNAIADKAGLGGAFTIALEHRANTSRSSPVLLLFPDSSTTTRRTSIPPAGGGSRPAHSSARCSGSRSPGSSRWRVTFAGKLFEDVRLSRSPRA